MPSTGKILLNDFQRQWECIGPKVLEAVERVGRSGWYILGQEVRAFEAQLAAYWGLKHAAGVGNGMDALEIGLRCLNIGPGAKVLTTPLSAFATTLAIMRVGAEPVFVDVDEYGLLDLAQCRDVLRHDPDLRAIVPVHLYGFPINLQKLDDLKREFSLVCIEDCAQAMGASFRKQPVGTVGQMAATSFYPTKNLGAMGDGGALLCNDGKLAQRACVLRHYGQTVQYAHQELGLNSRLDEVQAAILRDALLPKLAEWTERRSAIATRYLREIANPHITLLHPAADMAAVWHLFPVLVAPEQREGFRATLAAADITTGIHYPHIIPEQAALLTYKRFRLAKPLPTAERFARGEVSLPINPLLTETEVTRVVEACNQWKP